jgi:geranylgeranyl pyrophosphate synthase
MDTRTLYEECLSGIVRQVEQQLIECPNLEPEFKEMYLAAVGSGMRFRPCLAYIAHRMCGGGAEEALMLAAVAIELLHKASLIHDDLIDGDTLRRGNSSFHHVYGSEKAVIMGDFLVARAYLAMNDLEEFVPLEVWREVRRRFTAAHRDMCSGELLELVELEGIPTLDRAERVLIGKTASLIEQSLAIGAVLGGGNVSEVNALAKYGRLVGVIFQTANDINNLSGFDSDVKGASLSDLAGRRVGFPIVGLAKYLGKERFENLCQLAEKGGEGKRLAEIELTRLMEKGQVRLWLDRILGEFRSEAINALSVFPQSLEKQALESVGMEMFESWFWRPHQDNEG